MVTAHPNGGYAVAESGPARPANERERGTALGDVCEAIYFRIVEVRLNCKLPDRFTENELMRRYDITRVQLGAILRRITQKESSRDWPVTGGCSCQCSRLPKRTSRDSAIAC
uniref:hypothetical protein n=1 Tax=Cupriavidus taiwanensis TaxID=164546 RepID=UPI0013316B7D|nr:hypothetical protein [Cupriavidus taiwanensis]